MKEGAPASDPNGPKAVPPKAWQEGVLDLLLTRGLSLGSIAVVIWFWLRATPKLDALAVAMLVAIPLLFALRLIPSVRFELRAVVALALLWALGAISLARVGYLSGPSLALATFVVIGGTTLGRRGALVCLAVVIVTFVVVGYFHAHGIVQLRTDDLDMASMRNWFRVTTISAVVTGLLVLVVTQVIAVVERNLEATQAALAELRNEQQHRESLEAQRRQAEASLREAQKLEALGRLAGGVAHDFNNALVVIMGWADALRHGATPEETTQGLEAIGRASNQAAQLTRQLLSFARREVVSPRPLELDAIIESTARSLRRLLGADVAVTLRQGGVPPILADEGQLNQVLLNLVVNARDAMPRGGTLTLETRRAPGGVVELVVSDTGVGMDEATKARLFEPFFTTKESGRGTGLGLATVHGIVAQAGGYVRVESELGRGATFIIGFPEAVDVACGHTRSLTPIESGQRRTVLLAEDDEAVRRVMATALADAGYTLLEAGSVERALELARRHRGEIHLLCTDAVMPGTSTSVLIENFRQLYPGAPVLVCSGHVEEELVRRGIAEHAYAYLRKPFDGVTLVAKVAETLARRGSEGA